MGAILAGASSSQIRFLEKFAENLGIAFQIKDDIIRIFSDEDTIGKNLGSDITEFKQTFLYSYTKNNIQYKEKIKKYYGKSNIDLQDIIAVRNIFKDSGALSYAKNQLNIYFNRAQAILENDFPFSIEKGASYWV